MPKWLECFALCLGLSCAGSVQRLSVVPWRGALAGANWLPYVCPYLSALLCGEAILAKTDVSKTKVLDVFSDYKTASESMKFGKDGYSGMQRNNLGGRAQLQNEDCDLRQLTAKRCGGITLSLET